MKEQLFLLAFLFALKTTTAQEKYEAINLNNIDKSVRPQDDLYKYTNGLWLKKAVIPSSQTSWGSTEEVKEQSDEVLLKLIHDLGNEKFAKGTKEQKITDMYKSYLDFNYRNKIGLKPIKNYLNQIDNIQNLDDLQAYLQSVTSIGGNPFYNITISSDLKNSSQNAVFLDDVSLTLGKNYYQVIDQENTNAQKSLKRYIDQVMPYTGSNTQNLKGSKFVAFEKKITTYLRTAEEEADPNLLYNPVKLSDLKQFSKNIDFEKYVKSFGINPDVVIISTLDYYKNIDKILNQENLPLIKDYLKFRLVNIFTDYSTDKLAKISFNFYNKDLKGQVEDYAPEMKALTFVDTNIGELLGQIYVKENFSPEAKNNALELVHYLFKSYEARIKGLDWMSDTTKQKALEKLSKFTVKIGYPDKWRDYSALEIKSNSEGGTLIDNFIACNKWSFDEMINNYGKPVDKSRWSMKPYEVNAYYDPSVNEIAFPAAILKAPFYDNRADAAVNFGGIGGIIGHEITHGFDNTGAKFDGNGNLINWWTKEDEEKFTIQTKKLQEQFSAYEPVKGVHVNGILTSGENIADLGGLNIAYEALQMYLKDKGLSNDEKIDGYSIDERFFMSYAECFRLKIKNEAIVNQIKEDSHSPDYYRVVGTVVNMDAFHNAYQTKKGDKLYKAPKDRIKIW